MQKSPATTRTSPYQADQGYKPFFGGNTYDKDSFFSGSSTADKESAPAKRTPPAPVDLTPEKGAKLREALAELFQAFNGKVVGDKEFDDIIKESSWDKRKESEQNLKKKNEKEKQDYETQLAQWNMADESTRGDKPAKPVQEPVKVYTTCIDTQRKVLEKALGIIGVDVKKVSVYDNNGFRSKSGKKAITYSYGSLGPQQAKELGAWQEATPNMKERPKPGDILVLAFRGKEVDKAATDIAGMEALVQKSKDTATAAEAFHQKAEEAKAAVAEAQASGDPAKIKAAKSQVIAANNLYANALAKAKAAATNAKGSVTALPKTYEKLDKARAAANHERFQFSHVGFYVSHKVNADGSETWTTFDGGQTLDAKGGKKQGASMTERRYHPALNEIAGEKSQDGSARWLQGWVNVEKIAEMQPEAAD